MKKLFSITILSLMILLSSCTTQFSFAPPSLTDVSTGAPVNVTTHSFDSGIQFTNPGTTTGGLNIMWGTGDLSVFQPIDNTLLQPLVVDTSDWTINYHIDGLKSNTIYYVQAYLQEPILSFTYGQIQTVRTPYLPGNTFVQFMTGLGIPIGAWWFWPVLGLFALVILIGGIILLIKF